MQSFLKEEDRVALRTQHRQEKNRCVEDRIKAVLLSDKGWSGAIVSNFWGPSD
ncbi:hypothetical protein [Holospora undulata]|uniref:Uncharacterized protein n=1 Tax=Holospora undulata HU1 TaxID=1321371 RepID=A0A061JIJ4_9PROT|nr:hypothetical protein [Holospora undulata]ETZ04889.1 hypothetical protein K737_300684 [Holospora undulata HU1]